MIRFAQILEITSQNIHICIIINSQNKTSMSSHQFLADSDQEQLCPTFIRGVSHDDFLFALCNRKSQTNENPGVYGMPHPQIYVPEKHSVDMDNTSHIEAEEVPSSVQQVNASKLTNELQTFQPVKAKNQNHRFQPTEIPQFEKYAWKKEKTKKDQTKDKKDYKKNICGYITKKIVREFLSPVYKEKILKLCEKHGCDYETCISFYDKKIERITGPTHLDMLLNVNKQSPCIKRCFKEFFIWFLRYRYLRYLIIEGKMERKDIYIDYKNRTLLYLGSMEQQGPCVTEKESPELSQSESILS